MALARTLALGLAAAASGCAAYRPADLASAPRADPSSADLSMQAARLNLAAPTTIDLDAALTPEQLGLVAVIANPELQAQRMHLGVTQAQVFNAGLLPDPQFSFSLDRPLGDGGLVDAVAAGLGMDLSALYARSGKLRAAQATREQARLDLAWREWQVAGTARLQAARIQGLEQSLELARRSSALADSALERTLRAVARGDLSAGDLEARRLAAADAGDRVRTLERDLEAARFELNAALGLSPDYRIALAKGAAVHPAAPDGPALTARAYAGRLDLAALRAGYKAQDANLRSALLLQYPRLNLSLNAARDTSAVRTYGFGVGFDLPLWNRNRGAIAVEEATREQLRAEYEARLFTLRSEISTLIGAYAIGLKQRDDLAAQVAPLRRTVEAFERAGARGDIAPVAAETARQTLTDKEIALAALDQALNEQWAALELAAGTVLQ
ncbi:MULTISPECIES: TolC family protein [unclassified Brevundimonas]|uniref:TolC family protein n=1 Tax=unclassified Brevundimonas TaxID=2622653 RepID=UPI003F90C211